MNTNVGNATSTKADEKRSGDLARNVAFIIIMGALGNTLSFVSISLAPILPPQVSLDFSHLGTFVSALFRGPIIGSYTGFIVGLTPMLFYGFITGNLGIFALTIPIGKAITGLSSGFLAKRTKTYLAVTLGYIPEFLYTYAVLYLIWTYAVIIPPAVRDSIIFAILIKAWIEILILAAIMTAISRYRGMRP